MWVHKMYSDFMIVFFYFFDHPDPPKAIIFAYITCYLYTLYNDNLNFRFNVKPMFPLKGWIDTCTLIFDPFISSRLKVIVTSCSRHCFPHFKFCFLVMTNKCPSLQSMALFDEISGVQGKNFQCASVH